MPTLIWIFAGHIGHNFGSVLLKLIVFYPWALSGMVDLCHFDESFGSGHWKTCLILYANNKRADHPVHTNSLISAFVICCLNCCIIPIVSKSIISILWISSVTELASLSLTWSKRPKTGFLMTWLISGISGLFSLFVVHVKSCFCLCICQHPPSVLANYYSYIDQIWAGEQQNQQNDLCTQQRLRSAQSDQNLCCLHEGALGAWLPLKRTLKTQIWPAWCPEFDLRFCWEHWSFCWFYHTLAHLVYRFFTSCTPILNKCLWL